MFAPTPCKISTITATGNVNSLINLDVLYENVTISPSIVYIEYGKQKNDKCFRGVNQMTKKKLKNKEYKRFDNQVTCIVFSDDKYVNVKMFKNGKIQMTGLKRVNQGRHIIDIIIDNLIDIYNRGFTNIVEDHTVLKNIDYMIRLINSDFRVGIEIKRDKLNKLVQNTYNVLSSFEPCIYPGVKIQFFWKENGTKDGICKCTGYCDGKGKHNDCKKITIAVFQSGCIIITGAQTLEQISDAYRFICKLIKKNIIEIEKKNQSLANLSLISDKI